MKNVFTGILGICIFMAVGGCATSFTGSAHVEGGRGACEQRCRAQGMEVAGMVYMGEYSSACVCAVPGQTASNHQLLMASAATGGGAVGVVMQQRRQASNDNNGY